MKTSYFYIIFIAYLAVASCQQSENQSQEKVLFEVYETVTQNEVPTNQVEGLQNLNIELNSDTLSPIIAFVPVDSVIQFSKINNDKVKFLQTAQPVDEDKKYIGMIAVKNQSGLNTSDIKKTKPNQNNIEIYFNFQGANKWSELTKSNIGKIIAFSIDNKIYTLTLVNGEIKNGVVIVNGLEKTDLATKISKTINSSL